MGLAARTPNWARGVFRLARAELGLLLPLLVVGAAVWGFAELTDEVLEGSTRAVDRAVLLAFRTAGDLADPIGPGWAEEMGRDFTALGGVGVLTLMTVAAALYLLLDGKRHAALFVILAIASGITISFLLKSGFDRPRPDLVPHGSIVYTSSFPSGHSMMSAVVYLTLGTLLARIQARRRIKAYLLFLAALVTVAVGVSRIYLGVHWPSDVLAGWAAGAAWAMAWWALAVWLQRRGRVERSDEERAEAGQRAGVSRNSA